MAEESQSSQTPSSGRQGSDQKLSESIGLVREELDRLAGEIDFNRISERLQSFGRENPIGLATMAFGVGIALGFLTRRQ